MAKDLNDSGFPPKRKPLLRPQRSDFTANSSTTMNVNANTRGRGRQKQEGGKGSSRSPSLHSPKSWIRSASATGILGLRRPELAHSHSHAPSTGTPAGGNRSPLRRSTANATPVETGRSLTDGDINNVVDVLPSFEMYNTLHRHIPQGNVDPDRHDFPPSYQEANNSTATGAAGSSADLSHQSLSTDALGATRSSSTSNLENLIPLRTEHHSIAAHQSTAVDEDSLDIPPILDDLNDTDNIFIDKLYTLPKMSTPIEITIKTTKHAPIPHVKPEEESILKEYTSGDLIHGFITIENKSQANLKFEMFYVTLESYISIIDKVKSKRTIKRFLRMVDLSASWSYSKIALGSGVDFIPADVDYDGSVFGLNNSRVLEPGVKYKKFFIFKLPLQLLDVTCKQEHFSHCLLPPSFGIDKYRNNCKYSGIKVNRVLGCGHLGTKGSPILTNDMSDDNLSINYTIDARIVGKDQKASKLYIMKEREYNLRVIPFGFDANVVGERTTMSQLNDITKLVQERLDALRKIFQRLEKKEPITNRDIHGADLSGTIDDSIESDSQEILQRKLDQLHIKNRNNYLVNYNDLKLGHDLDNGRSGNSGHNTDTSRAWGPFVESELKYKLKNKSNSSSFLNFSHFLNSSSSSMSSSSNAGKNNHDLTGNKERTGLILVKAKIPKQGLPYWAPSLLRKTNVFESKSKHDQENWVRLSELIPEDVKKPLEKLDLQLTCIESDNSLPHDPPEIQSITTELICITAKSDNSIPIKLNSELLMNKEKLTSIKALYDDFHSKICEYETKFNKNFLELNELYNMNRGDRRPKELKFTDFITSQLFNDIESICNLKVSVHNLSNIFKKQVSTLKQHSKHALSEDSISHTGNGSSSSPSSASLTPVTSSSKSSLFLPSGSSSTSLKFTDQIVHKWVRIAPLQYKRDINVNLEFNKDIKETLIPSFESCLCCRFYCVRVMIKFENHLGVAKIDIPISVRQVTK
ncbi:ubiquitin-ubiquitin ligase BUL1 [Saccharomyces cerevisiae S288C]|uniref:Ubiquitin ligase-binding protein BUL1 n=2 Tax=Saccharomyces cerevisiae TaxID=4932 RepID=BUL1_YEAST|eukprot:NP_014002.1 ubiquitin-ubiquitin ligase BUL1 [Saccharomyces cerevisiae S288C]